jgi:hypothetical protein
LAERTGAGGAVWAGGVAGAGGACALAVPHAAIRMVDRNKEHFICIPRKRLTRADVPRDTTQSVQDLR